MRTPGYCSPCTGESQDAPNRPEYFRSLPDPADNRRVDLGLWNIATPQFADSDHQARLPGRLCAIETGVIGAPTARSAMTGCRHWLSVQSRHRPCATWATWSPFMQNGSLDSLDAVVRNFRDNSKLARAGELRAGDPEMARMALSEQNLMHLVAFLEALNEDHEQGCSAG